jgi:hypothetical protein
MLRNLFNFIFLKINFNFKNKYFFLKNLFVKKNKLNKNIVFNNFLKLRLLSNIFYMFDLKFKKINLNNYTVILKKKKYRFLMRRKHVNSLYNSKDFIKLLNYLKFNRNIFFYSKKKLLSLNKKSFLVLPVL